MVFALPELTRLPQGPDATQITESALASALPPIEAELQHIGDPGVLELGVWLAEEGPELSKLALPPDTLTGTAGGEPTQITDHRLAILAREIKH